MVVAVLLLSLLPLVLLPLLLVLLVVVVTVVVVVLMLLVLPPHDPDRVRCLPVNNQDVLNILFETAVLYKWLLVLVIV